MKLLTLRPAIIVAALIVSQSACAGLLTISQPSLCAEAFNFGKKKKKNADAPETSEGGTSQDNKGTDAVGGNGAGNGASDDKGKAAAKPSKDEEPKEKVKHKSKADIQEEEELQAEYDAYQKQLSSLLKSVKTPFGGNNPKESKAEESELSPMSINGSGEPVGQTGHVSLGEKLRQLQCKIYMPARMMIGHTAEFTVKGRPGYWACLAMADKDKGAKPIYGHTLRLGPDRKVVALGKIPASGVLPLKIFAPIEGDLIGGNLYFEAAVWPENNPERLELALPVSSETQTASSANSVGIIGEGERKRGIKFVPDNRSPYSRVTVPGVGSGSPI